MKRRAIMVAVAKAGLGLGTLALLGARSFAQRPANPIYRPRPGRPDGSPARGRLAGTTGGVVGSGLQPGAFTVRGVDTRQNLVQLGDDDGRTAQVYVDPKVYDLSALKSGDEVEVDFVVQAGSNGRLQAAGVWKLERVATP